MRDHKFTIRIHSLDGTTFFLLRIHNRFIYSIILQSSFFILFYPSMTVRQTIESLYLKSFNQRMVKSSPHEDVFLEMHKEISMVNNDYLWVADEKCLFIGCYAESNSINANFTHATRPKTT